MSSLLDSSGFPPARRAQGQEDGHRLLPREPGRRPCLWLSFARLARQAGELRYDPFDLTRIEVWYNDAFLELVQPEEIVNIRHPDVELDPAPKPPPDSGLDYVALLRMERECLIQAQPGAIQFTQLDPSNPEENTSDDNSE